MEEEEVEVKASIDRFDGEFAIAYSDDKRKFEIPGLLVPIGAKPGSRVWLRLKDDRVITVDLDREGTKSLDEKIKEKLEHLKRGDHLK